MIGLFVMVALLNFTQLGTFADAADFSVLDNRTGQRYECGQGGGSGDSTCIKDLSGFCASTTSFSSTQCFEFTSTACRGANDNFKACVMNTAEYCRLHTSYSSNVCFSKALDSCSGNFNGLKDLLDEVRLKALNNN